MLIHILGSLALLAAGFGLGRIKNLKGAEAKVSADVKAVEAEAKKL